MADTHTLAELLEMQRELTYGPRAASRALASLEFLATMPSEDQVRFTSEFSEAVAESVRLGNPTPAAFLLESWRQAYPLNASNSIFSGNYAVGTREALVARLPER